MQSTFSVVTNEPAFGGRIGLWWPEAGLAGGISAMHSNDYINGFRNSISLWAVDVNYHKGNWDLRAEYGMTYQQTQPFLPTDITRQGFYAQAAYRPRDASNRYLQNVELVYRYCYVNFKGIDPTTLDLTTFTTPVDVPVRRQQHEVGVNYYFAPRLALKCAYQVNDEPGFHLHDNQFLTELAWGW
jgi:predicted porin